MNSVMNTPAGNLSIRMQHKKSEMSLHVHFIQKAILMIK